VLQTAAQLSFRGLRSARAPPASPAVHDRVKDRILYAEADVHVPGRCARQVKSTATSWSTSAARRIVRIPGVIGADLATHLVGYAQDSDEGSSHQPGRNTAAAQQLLRPGLAPRRQEGRHGRGPLPRSPVRREHEGAADHRRCRRQDRLRVRPRSAAHWEHICPQLTRRGRPHR